MSRLCERCGHYFDWVFIDDQWWPWEYHGAPIVTYVWDGQRNVRREVLPARLHQCQRQWIREYESRFDKPCPKCGAHPSLPCMNLNTRGVKQTPHQERNA